MNFSYSPGVVAVAVAVVDDGWVSLGIVAEVVAFCGGTAAGCAGGGSDLC